MLQRFLIICSLCLGNIVWGGVNLSELSLAQLDEEQFKRLEKGGGDPSDVALEIIERSKQQSSIYLVNAYTVLGIVNKNKGFYVSALNYNLKALSVAESLKDQGRISACMNNIGILYDLQENYEKAIVYFEKSLKLEEKLNQPLQRSIRLFNLGDSYNALGQFDEAIGYYTSSLIIEKKLKNELGVVYAELGLIDVYLKTDRLTDANALLKRIDQSAFDFETRVLHARLSGVYLLKLNQTDEAIHMLKKAENLAKQYDLKAELLQVFSDLAQAYAKQGDAQAENTYLKAGISLNKELQSNLIKNQLEDLTYQQEMERKEMELMYVKEQKNLAEKNAQAMKDLRKFDWRITIFSLFGMFSLVVLVVIGLKRLTRTV
jgi:tetratricopeptide (TPR) repeat protein